MVDESNEELSPRRFHFVGAEIDAGFEQAPALAKITGCPDWFVWDGTTYRVVELLAEWHVFDRRGRMAVNMRPAHAAAASRRGSWGVGRAYYRVRTVDGRIFEIYYDRAPKNNRDRLGAWFLFQELFET